MTSRVLPLTDHQKCELRSVFEAPYMNGLCVAFAVAAHRRTGWPIAALRNSKSELLHAGAHVPGGGYLDVRGILNEQEFTGHHVGTVSWAEEWAILYEAPNVQERDIEKAANLLGLLFDGLPGSDA